MVRTLDICRTAYDEIARLYDEVRPCYPHQLVKDVLLIADLPPLAAKILEVGSGTGKATEHFVKNTHDFFCVEPGPKSIEIARSKLAQFPNIHFENNSFEDWNSTPASFDLVFSGQAFHWIDSDISFAKAAEVLKVGGTLALFWNTVPPEASDLDQALDEVYNKFVPLSSRSLVEALPDDLFAAQQESLKACGKFERLKTKRYSWTIDYTAEAYIRLMQSFTHVHLLSDGVKRVLLNSIKSVILDNGGVYTKPYSAVLLAARKVTNFIT